MVLINFLNVGHWNMNFFFNKKRLAGDLVNVVHFFGVEKNHRGILVSSWPPSCNSPVSKKSNQDVRYGIQVWKMILEVVYFSCSAFNYMKN